MSNRTYLALSAIVATAGGLIVVATFAFSQDAANWIAFGLSVIALAGSVALIAVVPSVHAARYRVVAGAIGAGAAFTIIASVGVFNGGAQHWILFGGGVAALLLASVSRERYVAGLVEPSSTEAGTEEREPLLAAARAATDSCPAVRAPSRQRGRFAMGSCNGLPAGLTHDA